MCSGQVATGAYERLVFQVSNGKQITDPALIVKITWASWTRYIRERKREREGEERER